MAKKQNSPNSIDNSIMTEDWSLLPKNPTVSICSITYNHRNFISDAIEGFLMQETDFPIEILVHDDASTDGTADIVRDYQAKHPHLIRSVLQTENQWSQGGKPGSIIRSFARGKYIALCEGDDYWTDPLKLQKQVDFLESHPECSTCAHNALIIDGVNGKQLGYKNPPNQKEISDITDILLYTFIQTATVLFRREALAVYPQSFQGLGIGDWPLFVHLSLQGKIGYINRTMSVFRMHPGGMVSGAHYSVKISRRIKVAKEIFRQLDDKYQPFLAKNLIITLRQAAIEFFLTEFNHEQFNLDQFVAKAKKYCGILIEEINLDRKTHSRLRSTFWSVFYRELGFGLYRNEPEHPAIRLVLLRALYFNPTNLKDRGFLSRFAETFIGIKLTDKLRRTLLRFKEP